MLVDLITQAGVADVVQSHELIEPVRATVRHHKSVERDREPTLAIGLHWVCLAEDSRAGGNEDMATVMRVDRVCYQAIHRSGDAAIQPVRQHGIDKRALQDRVRRTDRADWSRR